MGYRSQVRCLIYGSKQDVDAFLTAHVIIGGSRVLQHFSNTLSRYAIDTYDGFKLHVLDLNEESCKWYSDYEEIIAWEAFMNEAPDMGLEYEFYRLGEEFSDIEERRTEGGRGFLYTTSPTVECELDPDTDLPILFEGATT
jgi:hypothetical protein